MTVILPNLGFEGRWADQEDGWGDSLNEALEVMSIAIQAQVLDAVSTLPSSPSDGDIYIYTGTGPEQDQIAARIDGAWEYFTPRFGWKVYNLAIPGYMTFTSSGWVSDPTAQVSAFTDLSDVQSDYVGKAGYAVVINSAEDGVEFVAPSSAGASEFVDLTDTPASYSGQSGKLLAVNSAEDGVEFVAPSSAGASEFVDLTDTPASYSGQSGKLLAVNSAEDGVEFVAPSSALPSTSGQNGKTVVVNDSGTDYVLRDGLIHVNVSASRDFAETDFYGDRVLVCDSSSPIVLNLPSGLSRIGPCLIFRKGTGEVSVSASTGVTLTSPDSFSSLRLTGSVASVVPLGSNQYVLSGDIYEGFAIPAGSVTRAMLENSAALSVIGNGTNSSAAPADITASSNHQVLRRSGTTLGFGAVALNEANAVSGQLPVANGGTGASTAAAARTNLGLGTASTSDVTTSATDTTAGRLTKVSDFGIGSSFCPVIPSNDFTEQLASGFWRASEAASVGHPTTNSFNLGAVVVRFSGAETGGGGGHGVFTFRHAGTVSNQRIRYGSRQNNTGSLTWVELIHNGRLVGTVSESAGTPTGTVFERGSNANGEYVRFADGTQICTRTLTASASAATTWTFPAAFAAAPVVSGAAVATVLAALCLDSAPTATNVSLSVRDKNDARRADNVHLTAIGRWF